MSSKMLSVLLAALFLGQGWAYAADALPSGVPGSSDVKQENRTIAVGAIDVIDLDFQPRSVQIGTPSIMEYKEGTSLQQIRLTPLKAGTTQVLIDDQTGKTRLKLVYNIITNDLSTRVEAIRSLLFDIEGITVASVGERIVIDGELIVPKDLDRILAVQAAYGGKDVPILNLVTLSKVSREAMARRIQKEINDDPGGVNVTVRVVNETFFLLGKVDSTADKERAETIAVTYFPGIQTSEAMKEMIAVPKRFLIRNLIQTEEPPPPAAPKMVRVTYHFVEIGKEFLKSSMFKWTPLLSEGAGIQFGQSSTGGVASSSNGSFTGIISNLIPKLTSGANGGFARVLFSSVGIGLDGEKLEIQRTDNIPYISAVVNGVPIPDSTPVGVNIAVTPMIQGEDKIKLDTQFSFKADAGAGAGGKIRTTDTTIHNQIMVKSGDSAVIGGLVNNHVSKDIDKDPEAPASGTGSALFTLLRSKAFRNNKTQFVVFITPKIITDAAEGTADIKSKIINNNKKRQRSLQ